MSVHRTAKTTPQMRRLIHPRVTQGWTQAAVAEALGISVRTVAKWVARGRVEGGLLDGSSRPHRQPRRLGAPVTAAIVGLRRTRATAWQISAALGVPRSTVTRELQRVGLNRLATLDPAPEVHRYEWPHAGDLRHLDIKRVGRLRGVGHRIHGDRRTRARGVGWEYIHVAIDDATRLAYVEGRRAHRARLCAAFFQRAVGWFRRRGIRIRRLLTDTGSAYRSKLFARAARTGAVRHRFTRPYRPQTNGKAERLIQTLLREWAYRHP